MTYIGKNNELLFLNFLKRSTQIVYDKNITSPLTIIWIQDEKTIISYETKEIILKKNS